MVFSKCLKEITYRCLDFQDFKASATTSRKKYTVDCVSGSHKHVVIQGARRVALIFQSNIADVEVSWSSAFISMVITSISQIFLSENHFAMRLFFCDDKKNAK